MGDLLNFDKLVEESFFLDRKDRVDLLDLLDRIDCELVVLDNGAPSLEGEFPMLIFKLLVLLSFFFSSFSSPA